MKVYVVMFADLPNGISENWDQEHISPEADVKVVGVFKTQDEADETATNKLLDMMDYWCEFKFLTQVDEYDKVRRLSEKYDDLGHPMVNRGYYWNKRYRGLDHGRFTAWYEETEFEE